MATKEANLVSCFVEAVSDCRFSNLDLSLLLSQQTLRVQCPAGRFIVNKLTVKSTLGDLQQCITDLTNLTPERQKCDSSSTLPVPLVQTTLVSL